MSLNTDTSCIVGIVENTGMLHRQCGVLPMLLCVGTCICSTLASLPGLDPLQSTPVPVSYTKYVTKHMSKIEMGKSPCNRHTLACETIMVQEYKICMKS